MKYFILSCYDYDWEEPSYDDVNSSETGASVKSHLILLSLFRTDNVECVSQCVSRYSPYFRGYYMKVMDCPGATLRNLTLADDTVVCCVFDTAMVPSIPPNIDVSMEVYLDMVGDTTRTRALYPFYMQALSTADISGKQEIAAFTAQVSWKKQSMYVFAKNGKLKCVYVMYYYG